MSPAKKSPGTAKTDDRKRLVLIDGNSLIHRSFHGLKHMKEPLKVAATGELIFGTYGFANTFLSMFKELNPTHVIIALDHQPIEDIDDFRQVMDGFDADSPLHIQLKRGRATFSVEVE